MIITISGLSGSGKSTAARLLSERLKIPTVDVGKIFRAMAKEHGMDVAEFGRFAEANPKIDRELDRQVIADAKKRKDLILQSRLAGWMTKRARLPAFRVWIAASAKVRAKRIAGREDVSAEKAGRDINRRDRQNRARYQKTYGLDLNDLSLYDTVIRTDNRTAQEVVDILFQRLAPVWLKTQKLSRMKPKKTLQPRRKSRLKPSK